MYQIQVSSVESGEALAQAYGDVDTMAYVGRKLGLGEDKEYRIEVTEHEKIGGEPTRSLVSLTADGEIVALMLKKKLTAERKRLNIPADTENTGESTAETPSADASVTDAVPAGPTPRSRGGAK